MLAQISDRLEDEINKLKAVQSAIALKEKELQELYEIERSAVTLAALIEAQHQKRQDFELEMGQKKEMLTQDIEALRAEWERERNEYEEEKRRERRLKRKGEIENAKSTSMPLKENKS